MEDKISDKLLICKILGNIIQAVVNLTNNLQVVFI
jgi:hypothetical protein